MKNKEGCEQKWFDGFTVQEQVEHVELSGGRDISLALPSVKTTGSTEPTGPTGPTGSTSAPLYQDNNLSFVTLRSNEYEKKANVPSKQVREMCKV
jgi:hypothetical protein